MTNGVTGSQFQGFDADRAEPRATWSEQLAWAERNLPDEHPPFVVVAASILAGEGHPVTPGSVADRLRVTGRSREQLEASGAP